MIFRTLGVGLVLFALTATTNAQVPTISGTIFFDDDMSGGLDTGEELVGVTVDLFEDNGDGVFDSNVDTLITSEMTDANGLYSFDSLSVSSNYFVRQESQMVGDLTVAPAESTLLSLSNMKMMIDDFADQQMVEDSPAINGNPQYNALNLSASGAIGGQRDMRIDKISGFAESILYSNPHGMKDVLELNQSAGVISIATVTWDGIDGDHSTTPVLGLGGIDLTMGGDAEAFAFDIGVDAAGAGESLILRIFSGSEMSEAVSELPVTDGTAMTMEVISFADFVGGADFTSVDAIQLELGGLKPSIDAQLGAIGLIGDLEFDISAIDANQSGPAIPEPSSILMGLFALSWFAVTRKKRNQ